MIILDTLGLRWWVLLFVAALAWAASAEGGWRRPLRFLAVAAPIALAAEIASTRTGFPFGRYTYLVDGADELLLAGVPVFVPIGWPVVVWGGRALLLAALPWASRRPAVLVAGGAVGAGLIDLVLDPMTHRGEAWFLGSLYTFEHGGYFGVPWSNLGGWVLTAAVILALDEAWGHAARRRARMPAGTAASAEPAEPAGVARGLAIAFGTMGFFVVLAAATRHPAIAAAGAAWTAGAAGAILLGRRFVRASDVHAAGG